MTFPPYLSPSYPYFPSGYPSAERVSAIPRATTLFPGVSTFQGPKDTSVAPQSASTLFPNQRLISVPRAVGGIVAGVVLGILGGKLFRQLAKPVVDSLPHKQSQTFLFLQKPLSSLYGAGLEQPKRFQTLAIYGLITIVGYLSANIFRGLQEAWVRREETGIRSQLLDKLQGVFRESIVIKQTSDQDLKNKVIQQMTGLLKAHGVQWEKILSPSNSWRGDSTLDHFYAFYSFPRQTPVPAFHFKGVQNDDQALPVAGQMNALDTPQRWVKPLDCLFAGLGLMIGLVLQGISRGVKVYREAIQQNAQNVSKEVTQSIGHHDIASLLLLAEKNKILLLPYLLMTAAASVGKLWIDGLREIEVTRANAVTEYNYQAYNWKALDPSFHSIAEEQALAMELQRLETDLPMLKGDPIRLRQRIAIILQNIGFNSAPKYFSMTPPVNLALARG